MGDLLRANLRLPESFLTSLCGEINPSLMIEFSKLTDRWCLRSSCKSAFVGPNSRSRLDTGEAVDLQELFESTDIELDIHAIETAEEII